MIIRIISTNININIIFKSPDDVLNDDNGILVYIDVISITSQVSPRKYYFNIKYAHVTINRALLMR